jgi:hypothetical protein
VAGESRKAPQGIGLFGHRVEHVLRRCRAYTGEQLHQAKAGDTVARVLDETQQRQHVFHMRAIEKLKAAELHERNVAPGEFDLERAAVVGCAK